MDGWMDECTNAQVAVWMDELIDGWMDYVNQQVDAWLDRWKKKQ